MQDVALRDGVIRFKGDVDFAPVYKVVRRRRAQLFPAEDRSPGAVANAAWSSIVVLPSGLVLNAPDCRQ